MKILEAVKRRKSIRKFLNLEIEEDLFQRISQEIMNVQTLYMDSEINYVISSYCSNVFQAPYYIGVYTDGTEEGLLNAGYFLQQIVIYLTAIGIATCYQVKNIVFKQTDISGRKIAITLAFGYPDGEMYRNEEEVHRIELDKLCVFKEKPNNEVIRLLNLARIAPSSYNMQPWRFVVYNNRFHIFCKKKMLFGKTYLNNINMGIMIANITVGAEEMWIDINVKAIDMYRERSYGDNKYVTSIYNNDFDGKCI